MSGWGSYVYRISIAFLSFSKPVILSEAKDPSSIHLIFHFFSKALPDRIPPMFWKQNVPSLNRRGQGMGSFNELYLSGSHWIKLYRSHRVKLCTSAVKKTEEKKYRNYAKKREKINSMNSKSQVLIETKNKEITEWNSVKKKKKKRKWSL